MVSAETIDAPEPGEAEQVGNGFSSRTAVGTLGGVLPNRHFCTTCTQRKNCGLMPQQERRPRGALLWLYGYG